MKPSLHFGSEQHTHLLNNTLSNCLRSDLHTDRIFLLTTMSTFYGVEGIALFFAATGHSSDGTPTVSSQMGGLLRCTVG